METCVVGVAVSLAIETSPGSRDEDSYTKNKSTDLNRGWKLRSVEGDSIEIGMFYTV